jgi:hypothetical protein
MLLLDDCKDQLKGLNDAEILLNPAEIAVPVPDDAGVVDLEGLPDASPEDGLAEESAG